MRIKKRPDRWIKKRWVFFIFRLIPIDPYKHFWRANIIISKLKLDEELIYPKGGVHGCHQKKDSKDKGFYQTRYLENSPNKTPSRQIFFPPSFEGGNPLHSKL
jgi:hypothetical protein